MSIIHGDGLGVARTLASQTFDLVVLDPDYQRWEQLLTDGLLAEAHRLVRPTGNIVCFTRQPFDFDLRVAVQPTLRRQIVWSFSNGGAWCSPHLPLISHQLLFWCSPSPIPFFEPRSGMAYSEGTRGFVRSRKVFGDYDQQGREFVPSDDGTWMRDHFHINKPITGQVFEKPTELLSVLIRCLTPEHGAVFDPFAGSGAVMKSAAAEGRSCVSVEIDGERVSAIQEYIEGRLFL